MNRLTFRTNIYLATLYQTAIPLILLWLTRFGFYIHNASAIGELSFSRVMQLAWAGLPFDLSAWAYFNVLFVTMRFLPFSFIVKRWWVILTNVIFAITNSVMLTLNIGDIPFYQFSGTRQNLLTLKENLGDPEILRIMGGYASQYWWAYLMGGGVILLMLWLAFRVRPNRYLPHCEEKWQTWLTRIIFFLLAAAAMVFSMRGRIGAGRPLSAGDAAFATHNPSETPMVLNTPFCVIRASREVDRLQKLSFFSEAELAGIRSSLHNPKVFSSDSIFPDTIPGHLTAINAKGKNVMIILLESGAQHWSDRLNIAKGDKPRGLMPFLDSIATRSLCVTSAYATGRRTIEGVTAVFGGFPTFGEMQWMTSSYSGNTLDSPARLLTDFGYDTRFYFGANHGSYSIDQFAKNTGFKDVADRVTYGNDRDYDGTWGIFDHAMGQFAAKDMSKLRQPFFTGWLTINLHGPWAVPDYWNTKGYKNRETGLERSVEYTDRALRSFFETARTQPWFDNTIFIITADHGCRDLKGTRYDTPFLMPHIMFMVYAPDGSIKPRIIHDRPMTQFDITPTLLNMVGYDKPYVALGTDFFDNDQPHYAINFINGAFQVMSDRWMVRMDPKGKVTEVYDIQSDQETRNPLKEYDRTETGRMARWGRAFLQDYTTRVIENRMSASRN